MGFENIIRSIKKKQSVLILVNSIILIVIIVVIFAGIYIFSTESLNVQNQIVFLIKEDVEREKDIIKKLNEEKEKLKSYLIPLEKINRSIIEEYQFEELKKLRDEIKDNFNKESIICNEQKLWEFTHKYLGLTFIASSYEDLEDVIKRWNSEQKGKYGEYFSKQFYDYSLLGISNWEYTNEDSKYKGDIQVKFLNQILSVGYREYHYDAETISREMKKFNTFVENIIAKVNKEIESSYEVLEKLNNKLSDEIKRLEQPNVLILGVLISKGMTAIFLFFLIQILLSTFRYLLRIQNRCDNQLLAIKYLEIKPEENYKILSILFNEKIDFDEMPEPLIKDIINLLKLK